MVLALEERPVLTSADLNEVRDLYQRGLYLQAYEHSARFGPLRDWTGTAARVLAGRLAGVLGGVKLSAWHFIKAWRSDRNDADACWFMVRHLLDTRGPHVALKMLQRIGDVPGADAQQRAQWLAQHAAILGRLRDFGPADRLMKQALDLDPTHPWIQCELSGLMFSQDRLDEAFAAEKRALELRPWYRPALTGLAYLLVQMERDTEALDLLKQGCEHIESSHLWVQLAFLQIELRQYAEARRSLEEYVRLSPLLEKATLQWLEGRRSDAAYYCGDLAAAAEHAKKAATPFFEQMAKRLSEPAAAGKRVHWPVPFVRQHHSTCVPATLAAISRYWSMPADHLEVAAEICYDGTPHHSERRWAEEHGWAVREFTVTWESAVALLDRGVPFTLTTQDPGNSHLQAVMGYDSIRGTLLIRDPGERHHSEFSAEAFFERYRPSGPRGLALVPAGKAELLAGLSLPNADLHDQMHRLQRSLYVHDRAEAEQALRTLESQAPNHYLYWLARRSLAQYDGDVPENLTCAEGMLALFPSDVSWQLVRASCLRLLGQQHELLAIYKELSERRPPDPLCWQQYAQELAADAREYGPALHLLRVAMRSNPMNAGTYSSVARIRWGQRRFDDAVELDRIAACLADKDEGLAQNYFSVARSLGRTQQALDFLRERFARLAARSSLPARTLTWAYGQLDRSSESLAVLDEAIRLRPADGDLLVYAAEINGNLGRHEQARQLLTSADGKSQRNGWLRTAATLAVNEGDRPAALALWRQLLEIEPLHLEAHRTVCQLLSETTGRAAALEHLQQTCARFEHNLPLNQLFIEWSREDGPEAVEPLVRKMVASHGADAWSRRELVLLLADRNRLPEAFAEMDVAERLEPNSAVTWTVRGRLLYLAGKAHEANEAYRQAIRYTVDHDYAIRELFNGCDNMAERREMLVFVEQQLLAQITYGNGLLTYRDYAVFVLSPEELLASLQKVHAARPDLWIAWSTVIRQLIDMDRVDDALVLARQAVERFPLVPGMWLDLAAVHRRAKEPDGEIEVLQSALEINPGWSPALCALAEVYQIKGNLAGAREVLERAIARAPLSHVNHGALADVLWKSGAKDEAVERIQQTLRLEPGYELGWARLSEWSRKLGRFDLPEKTARELTQRRPGEARSWLMLARMLLVPLGAGAGSQAVQERSQERLAVIDRAIELNPRLGDAYDIKAEMLARDGRCSEALAACRPAVWGDKPPQHLRGRAAWVIAQQGDLNDAIVRMRAVLAEDANYYWAWSQLADWLRATSSSLEYLEASENLVRLAPQTATSYGYRGEARLRLGRLAEAKEDFRRAIELSPDYDFAGSLLFDRQLADNELEQAAATLEQLRKVIAGAFVEVRAVELAARRRDKEAAETAFERLCQCTTPESWPFDAGLKAMQDAGWGESTVNILRRACRRESANANVVALWAQTCTAPRDIRECLLALDRHLEPAAEATVHEHAAQASADKLRLRDLKAELLGMLGRFDEAAAACRPPGIKQPLFLRGREVWINYQRGDRAGAIAMMHQLVAEDGRYDWGWRQLLSWLAVQKSFPALLAAADDLVQRGGPLAEPMLLDVARGLKTANERKPLLQLTERFRTLLRSTTHSWGVIGSLIGTDTDDITQAEWLSDWKERKDAQPWMLYVLVLALRGLARDEEANLVSRAALSLPGDHTTPFHRIYLALDEVLAGDAEVGGQKSEVGGQKSEVGGQKSEVGGQKSEVGGQKSEVGGQKSEVGGQKSEVGGQSSGTAEEHLRAVDAATLDARHAFLLALVQAVKSVTEAAVAGRAAVFDRERSRLAALAAELGPFAHDGAVLRPYRACIRRLAELRGGLAAKVWSMWRCFRPLLPKAPR